MFRIAIFVAGLLLASDAEAAVRSYFSPEQDGVRLGSCLADGLSCGKIAADAFCQKQGFTESILFAREIVTMSRPVDKGGSCETGQCEAFRRIKCFSPSALVPSTDQG